MITNLFTSNELATEIENITLCFIRDDIGEYINITVKDLINNWDDEKWENFTNYDPCMGDILVDDPDLNEIINASNYCPCWGGLFSDLDMINEYLLNGDGDLPLLSAIYVVQILKNQSKLLTMVITAYIRNVTMITI